MLKQYRGKRQPPPLKQMYTPIPLFIKDILKINVDRSGPCVKCSIFGLSFRSVVLYGRAFPWGAHAMNTTGEDIRIYKVDDGTGSILVHFAHSPNKLKPIATEIAYMEHEISTARKSEQPFDIGNGMLLVNDEKQKILDALGVMMTRINGTSNARKKYFDDGENVFIIARPSTCHLGDRFIDETDNQLHLFADTMLADNKLDNSFEINFKINIARFYEQNSK